MKKIIAILIVTLVTNQLMAQIAGPSAGAKILSNGESKKVNANTETMINGIPYSQYKAQQEALKQKIENQAKQTDTKPDLKSISVYPSIKPAVPNSNKVSPGQDNTVNKVEIIPTGKN